MYEDIKAQQAQQAVGYSRDEIARIWQDAIEGARRESEDRERRAVRNRKIPFGFRKS